MRSTIRQKIQLFLQTSKEKQVVANHEDEIKQLYQGFEKEFGRPLSPIELEMIGQWLNTDHYSPELIRLALREAVLNQAYSLKKKALRESVGGEAYSLKNIDRILLAW